MAERIVSPGVFTNEKDLSFLPAGIAAIGAAIIGPTTKGPAFVPTIINTYDDFVAKFGGLSEETYVPYTVKSYLKNAGTVTVLRVLQEGGYTTGVVNILVTPPTTAAATYNLTSASVVDTGSSAANLVGTSLANYTKLFVATSSLDLINAGTLASLGWFSASVSLTVTGSSFVSTSAAGAYYTALFQSQSITLPSSSATTYTANFTTYKTANTKLTGTVAPSAKNGSSNGFSLEKTLTTPTTLPASTSFALTLTGSGVSAQSLSGSVNPNSAISLDKVLGTSVNSSQNGYLYAWYKNYLSAVVSNTGVVSFESGSATTATPRVNLSGSAGTYSDAATPWITSQLITGQSPKTLFKIHTLSHGSDMNTAYKVSVINTLLPGDDPASDYGLFTVLIRDYNDTDQRPNVLETYNNCSLDPNSPNYVARKIGDKYYTVTTDNTIQINGSYDNVSKYVRVEMDTDVANKGVSPTLKPFGFQAFVQPVSSSYTTPSASYIASSPVINGAYNTKVYYGWDFAYNADNDNANYLKPLAQGAVAVSGDYFNLDSALIHPSASKVDSRSTFASSLIVSASTFKGLDISNVLKFSVALQGGFDGLDPAVTKKVGSNITSTNLFGFDCSSANANGSRAYIKALNIISNADDFDINLIVTPGATIADHSSIITKAIDVAETRGDTFVIADPVVQGGSVGSAIAAVNGSGIDSSYIGTYWPWVKIMDTDKNKPVWVPPSVVLPTVLAYNDSVGYEWFAPAGLNRGGITEAVDIETRLSFSQRDSLYENKINPIATFPNQGICVWGQKTLQAKPSALDRINVRRLLIALKKYIASSTRYLVFENNTTETRARFLNIVNPYLERVKSRQGIYAFRVVMDETNNTPDVIDRNIMYGQIYLQPAKAAEFIILDFNILPTGASFENA